MVSSSPDGSRYFYCDELGSRELGSSSIAHVGHEQVTQPVGILDSNCNNVSVLFTYKVRMISENI